MFDHDQKSKLFLRIFEQISSNVISSKVDNVWYGDKHDICSRFFHKILFGNYEDIVTCHQQSGGGEGGATDCYSVIEFENRFYKVSYTYASYDGYSFDTYNSPIDEVSVREVTPKKVIVTQFSDI